MLRGVTVEASAPRGVSAIDTSVSRGVVPDASGMTAWAGAPPVQIIEATEAGFPAQVQQVTSDPAFTFAFVIDDTGTNPKALFSAAEVQNRIGSATTISDVATQLDILVEDYTHNP